MTRFTSFLVWMDHHPSLYMWLVSALITTALALAISPLLRDRYEATRGPDWRWSLLILAILVAGRWPTFLFTRELGVDESQLLAGAHTLTHDPVFWRSVNGGTAGPLDFFALWPAGALCGWDTFLTARVTAAALLGLSLIFAHQAMALLLGRQVARLAGLVAVALEALTHAADLVHYSTELLPVALLAIAAYAAVRRWTAPGDPLWNGLGGVMLGAVPLGKLQVAPVAAVLGLCWLGAELLAKKSSSARHRAYLVGGAMLPAALFACQLTIAGEWPAFLTSYVFFNFQYAAAGSSSAPGNPLFVMLGNALWWDGLLPLTLLGALVWLALLVRLRAVPDRAIRLTTWLAAAACLVALASILGPKRAYLHYWQLLLVPGVFLTGAVIARLLSTSPPRWRRTEQLLVGLGATGLIGLMLHHRSGNPNSFVGDLAYFWHVPRSELADRVAAQARPGEALVIWGRADHLYVETGLRQGTRDSHSGGLIESGPLQAYNRGTYLADLAHNQPATFLDSASPASLQYATAAFAHERLFPELAAVIRVDYVLVEEFAGARIYRRRDLVAR